MMRAWPSTDGRGNVRARRGRLSGISVSHSKSRFVWRVCMGARRARRPKTAVSGPASTRMTYQALGWLADALGWLFFEQGGLAKKDPLSAARPGLACMAASHHRSSTLELLYQIREENQCLFSETATGSNPRRGWRTCAGRS